MINFNSDLIVKEMEKGLGDGDLTLFVGCTKCASQFELSKESVVMAIGNNTPFIEYLRWIQSSKCPNCHKEEE